MKKRIFFVIKTAIIIFILSYIGILGFRIFEYFFDDGVDIEGGKAKKTVAYEDFVYAYQGYNKLRQDEMKGKFYPVLLKARFFDIDNKDGYTRLILKTEKDDRIVFVYFDTAREYVKTLKEGDKVRLSAYIKLDDFLDTLGSKNYIRGVSGFMQEDLTNLENENKIEVIKPDLENQEKKPENQQQKDLTAQDVRNLKDRLISVDIQGQKASGVILNNQGLVALPKVNNTSIIKARAANSNFNVKILKSNDQISIGQIQDQNIIKNISPIAFGDAKKAQAGDVIFVLGNGIDYLAPVDTGRITKVYKDEKQNVLSLKSNASLSGSNLGSAILDVKGNIIGVNMTYGTDDTGSLQAAPINSIMNLMKS